MKKIILLILITTLIFNIPSICYANSNFIQIDINILSFSSDSVEKFNPDIKIKVSNINVFPTNFKNNVILKEKSLGAFSLLATEPDNNWIYTVLTLIIIGLTSIGLLSDIINFKKENLYPIIFISIIIGIPLLIVYLITSYQNSILESKILK